MSSDDEGQVVEAPPSSENRVTRSEVVEGTKAWVEKAKTFIFVEVSSLVLMFASIAHRQSFGKSSYVDYAISVSVISLAFCLILQTGEFAKPGFLEKAEKPTALFLSLWWAIGTGVVTFQAPFTVTSNGYFSAWAGLLFTIHWAFKIDTSQYTNLDKGRQYLVLLGACSAVLLFACIPWIYSCTGRAAWGIAAGVISFTLCAALLKLYDDISINVMKFTSGALFVIWAIVAGICTFSCPFYFTGNGYFASWGGLIISILFGLHQTAREDEIV